MEAECHRVALSDRADEARLSIFPEAMGNSSLVASWDASTSREAADTHFETVQTRTLDSFSVDGPTLIKIDVEGSELEVIQGAVKTLAEHHSALWVEVYKNRNRDGRQSGTGDTAVLSYLRSLGYRTLKVPGGGWSTFVYTRVFLARGRGDAGE